MIVDGHMKGTRLVCDYSEGEIECEEIGSVQVGCKKTPIKGSYYRVNHQFSTISTEQVGIIKIVIIFLVGKIRFWKQTLYTSSFFQSYLVSHTDNENQLQCKTEKRKQAANKHRSAGICCAVYNRGIIVGITELFGCESLSQVYVFLTWLWYTIATFPKLFAYDDTCHLKRFVNSRQKTAAGKFLASLTDAF